jgi:hypothetical protein
MALTKVSTGVVDMSQDTGGLVIAKGTTAQRPTCNPPTTNNLGSIRENIDSSVNKVEVCTSTGWQFLEEAGTSAPPLNINYLIVAGGGAGKNGGGGAGGMIEGSKEYNTSSAPIQLTVGSGGEPVGTVSDFGLTAGWDGEDSELTIDASEGAIVSTGGGQGGRTDRATGTVGTGGSGGGGGSASGSTTLGGLGNTPATTPPQGYDGGTNGNFRGSPYPSGGGGGAGAVGGNATSNNQCGNGGDGRQSSITGTQTYYAGGGGGGMYSSNTGNGSGGLGGGGDGIQGSGQAIQDGTTNTGGGGGGGGNYNRGGYGGSGVVILRYPSTYAINFQTGVGFFSSTATLSATSEKVTTITAGSGTITFALTP